MKTKTLILSTSFILVGCATAGDKANKAFMAKDYKAAYAGYLPLAQGGDAMADTRLAFMYSQGLGVTQDMTQAQKWYEKAAVDGDDLAARTLGQAYLYRVDADPDYPNAFKWYKLAGDRNDPMAALELSVFYENGLGVTRDHDVALHYLNIFVGRTDIVGQKTYFKYSGGDNTGGFMAAVQEVFLQAVHHTPEFADYHVGTVIVSFIEQDGRALDVKVEQSSGDRQADAAAVALLQKTYLPPVLASLVHVERFAVGFSFEVPKPSRLYGSGPASR